MALLCKGSSASDTLLYMGITWDSSCEDTDFNSVGQVCLTGCVSNQIPDGAHAVGSHFEY